MTRAERARFLRLCEERIKGASCNRVDLVAQLLVELCDDLGLAEESKKLEAIYESLWGDNNGTGNGQTTTE
jgi:hypothetical protein